MVKQIEDAQAINPGIKAAFVINKFNGRTLISQETESVLSQYPLPLLKTKIGMRVAYADTMTQGLTALEWSDKKAKSEMQELVDEVLSYEFKKQRVV